MANTDTVKHDRMHIRLDFQSKQKLERAAAYAHKGLSEFVLGQALNAADEVIHEHETLKLTEAEPKPARRKSPFGTRGRGPRLAPRPWKTA